MEENTSKEINLLQLISMFFRWVKKAGTVVFKGIGSLLQLAYKYKWIVIITTVLCVIAGQYLSRPTARIYKAEAMAMIYGSDAQTVKEICKQLENSLSTNNVLSLAVKVGIPDSVSKNIIAVRTFDVIDYRKDGVADKIDFSHNHSPEDTMNIKMNDRIYIQIKTTSITQVPLVQEALMRYFNSNQVLNAQFESKKNNIIDQIRICNLELQRIDSLAKVFYFKDNMQQMKFENNKLLIGENKKQLFYEELLRINAIKGLAQTALAQYVRPVNFPSDFVVNPNAVNGRLKYGVLSIMIGLLLSVLIALIVDNTKTFITFLENK
ncbi:MAG: hypothetical protein Q7U47_07690 [Paludibacter sp.]|nr:hypothetical protein [Paludibacter sp.]